MSVGKSVHEPEYDFEDPIGDMPDSRTAYVGAPCLYCGLSFESGDEFICYDPERMTDKVMFFHTCCALALATFLITDVQKTRTRPGISNDLGARLQAKTASERGLQQFRKQHPEWCELKLRMLAQRENNPVAGVAHAE